MYWETARGYTSGRSRRISPSLVIASLISLGWPREVILSASLCSLVPSLNFTIRSVVCVPALKSGDSSQAVARENSARSSWTAERLISVDLDIVSLDPYFSAYAETLGTIETLVKQKGLRGREPDLAGTHPASVRGGDVNYREDGHGRASHGEDLEGAVQGHLRSLSRKKASEGAEAPRGYSPCSMSSMVSSSSPK